jgi:4-amino-4-deoxy-L-arabinose transferase-like glycosyltransferase
MKRHEAWVKSAARQPIVYLLLVLLCYGTLLLPTVGRQGISWDEQTDIEIARSYLVRPGGWLRGSDSDPSQTRLPMAVVAVVYAVLGTDDLLTARLVSGFVGALTIVGVFFACKRDFESKTGVLAGAILATSPFFLSFARTAFTETDVFVACAFVWLLVAMSRLRQSGTLGWAAVAGVILGLALSAKFTAVVIFPAILLHILSFPQDRQGEGLPQRDLRQGVGLLAMMSAAMLVGWLYLNSLAPDRREDALLRFFFYLALLGWVAVIVWAVVHRDKIVVHRNRMLAPLLLTCFVLVLAVGTFMVVPPVHTTNPNILASLMHRFEHEMRWSIAFMAEAAVLHLASVMVKSSPLVGVGLLAGLVASALQWKAKPQARFLVLIVGFYFLGLVLLPLAQTFYMVPLLPILAILAADQLFVLMARQRYPAIGAGILAATVLAVDLVLCYPDFNLNGYQWVGARYIGNRSTIGYRSIVQTPSDGVEQVARWLNENVPRGDRVVAYLYPWHIVEATSPNPPFWLYRGDWRSVYTQPDYVVIHINHTVRQRWAAWFTGDEGSARAESIWWEPFDADWLRTHYTQVATVRRAFGLEMASIWERTDRIGNE